VKWHGLVFDLIGYSTMMYFFIIVLVLMMMIAVALVTLLVRTSGRFYFLAFVY
jgi:hypothetical protein